MSVSRKENGSLVKKAGRALVDLALNRNSNKSIANSAVSDCLLDGIGNTNEKFRFGTDGQGNYGYIKEVGGADTFFPFSGHVDETVLWQNPSPSSTFSGQTVTLSDDIDNYDYIKFEFKGSTQSAWVSVPNISIIYSVEDFKTTSSSNTHTRCAAAAVGDYNYGRFFNYVNDTAVQFGNSVNISNGSSVNTANIPLKVSGLKLRTTPKTPSQLSFILKAGSDGSSNGYSYITLPSEGYTELIAQSSLSRRLQVFGILSGVETKLLEVTSTAIQTVNITGYDHIMISTLSNGTSECNVSVIMN